MRTMDDVERVDEAIVDQLARGLAQWVAEQTGDRPESAWDEMTGPARDQCRAMARWFCGAHLSALRSAGLKVVGREPTGAMIAGGKCGWREGELAHRQHGRLAGHVGRSRLR